MNLRRTALLLASAWALVVPSFATEVGVTDTAIKIGVHTSLTGGASSVGQGSKVGISTAVAEINANGGISGRKLDVIFVDDRSAPDGGVAAVRRLIDDDTVFAVFGAGPS